MVRGRRHPCPPSAPPGRASLWLAGPGGRPGRADLESAGDEATRGPPATAGLAHFRHPAARTRPRDTGARRASAACLAENRGRSFQSTADVSRALASSMGKPGKVRNLHKTQGFTGFAPTASLFAMFQPTNPRGSDHVRPMKWVWEGREAKQDDSTQCPRKVSVVRGVPAGRPNGRHPGGCRGLGGHGRPARGCQRPLDPQLRRGNGLGRADRPARAHDLHRQRLVPSLRDAREESPRFRAVSGLGSRPSGLADDRPAPAGHFPG